MTPKEYLENYFSYKVGKQGINKIKKINLIENGILDSLDIATLSAEIRKKFKIDIKFNDEKSIKIFESYEKLLNKISK